MITPTSLRFPCRNAREFSLAWWHRKPQGPEEMCLSLEHQNPSKTSEKWVILIALQFRYIFYRLQTKRLRARKIGLQYKIRKGRKQIWDRFSNPWNANGNWMKFVLLYTRHFCLGRPSGDVPCASEDMACGYWFSKVDPGQIRSEEIVYSRFIKIPLG